MACFARSLSAVLFLCVASATAGWAQDMGEPRRNRIYAVIDGRARVTVATTPGLEWQVQDEAGGVVRPWGPADSGGAVSVPAGGWYRLMLRQAGQEQGIAIGGRFAAGIVILVTGQSQAQAMFQGSLPAAGAWPATAADPALPPVSAVLEDCEGPQPWCAGDHTFWQPASEGLGVRLMLAELSRRWQMPIGIVNAAYGGASAAQLTDPGHPAGNRLSRLAASAAPANAALILGHGTTDTFFPPPEGSFTANVRTLIATLRHHGARGMPVLLSPLAPLARPVQASESQPWYAAVRRWLGFSSLPALDTAAQARAQAIRSSQREIIVEQGLRDGGDLGRVTPGPDGIHWSEQGVREAARVSVQALLGALPSSGADRRQENRR